MVFFYVMVTTEDTQKQLGKTKHIILGVLETGGPARHEGPHGKDTTVIRWQEGQKGGRAQATFIGVARQRQVRPWKTP